MKHFHVLHLIIYSLGIPFTIAEFYNEQIDQKAKSKFCMRIREVISEYFIRLAKEALNLLSDFLV